MTEWFRVKQRFKKRKMNVTPSPPSLVDPQKMKTVQTEHKINKEQSPPHLW